MTKTKSWKMRKKRENADVGDDQQKEEEARDVRLDETEMEMEAGKDPLNHFYEHTCYLYTAGV